MVTKKDVIGSWDDFDPTAHEIAGHVARRVWEDKRDYVDLEDLESEAMLMLLTREDHQESIANEEYGLLHHRLTQDLINHCQMITSVPRNDEDGQAVRPTHTAIARTAYMAVSDDGATRREASSISLDDYEEERVNLYPDTAAAGDYTSDAVRLLLPAVWDESYAYGLPDRDDAPDKDMPRSAGNKARSNAHWAYIADIRSGWERTPLTLRERRALLLHFGMGWTTREIAHNQGVSQSVIVNRIGVGVDKIKARLNGEPPLTQEESN